MVAISPERAFDTARIVLEERERVTGLQPDEVLVHVDLDGVADTGVLTKRLDHAESVAFAQREYR
jgi:hypothetical protein